MKTECGDVEWCFDEVIVMTMSVSKLLRVNIPKNISLLPVAHTRIPCLRCAGFVFLRCAVGFSNSALFSLFMKSWRLLTLFL